jgi:hypothetical protein
MKWEYCKLIWSVRQITEAKARAGQERGDVFVYQVFDRYYEAWGALTFFAPTAANPIQVTTSIADTMEQLGLDGWELASSHAVTVPDNQEIYLFKRPLSQG